MQNSGVLILKPSPEMVHNFPDHAAQWLLEDPLLFRQFIELVDPELAKILDFSRARRINRKFVLKDFSELEHDITYCIPLIDPETGEEKAVYVYTLVEHQSEPDEEMPLRLFLYVGEIYRDQRREREKSRKKGRKHGENDQSSVEADRRWLNPVIPIVFFTGDKKWNHSLKLADMMPPLPKSLYRHIFNWETLFFDLKSVNRERLLMFGSAIGLALRVWQAERETIEELESRVMEAVAGVVGLSDEQRESWERVIWFFLQLIYNRRSENEYNDLYVKIREKTRESNLEHEPEVRDMGQTMAEVVEARAHERAGIATRNLLLDGLLARYKSLPSEIEKSISEADMETIHKWQRRAMTSDRLDEIFAQN